MFSAHDQQILRQIEDGLRELDRGFCRKFTLRLGALRWAAPAGPRRLVMAAAAAAALLACAALAAAAAARRAAVAAFADTPGYVPSTGLWP